MVGQGVWGGEAWRGADLSGRKHQGEEREVPGQRKVLTTSSHLAASLLILLTTWPDPTPEVGCREKLPERGKGVLLLTVGLSGAALQKEGPKSGAIGAKGLQAP